MTQMWPLTSQNTTSTIKMKHESNTTTTTTTTANSTTATTTAPSKSVNGTNSSSTCNCCCLVTKLMRKLKRRRIRRAGRQGSFQCLYDPLSYSLNFDSTGCGSLLDEDYYKFYAFSSRFVANPRTSTSSSCPVVQVAAGNSH